MQATVPQELDQQMHAHAGNLRSNKTMESWVAVIQQLYKLLF